MGVAWVKVCRSKRRFGVTVTAVSLLAGVLLAAAGARAGGREQGFAWRDRHAVPADDLYRSPLQLALNGNGRRLYVVCENSDKVLVVDTRRGAVVDSVDVGRHPFGIALSPDESKLYVSHRWDNDVAVVDLADMVMTQRIPVGDDPHQLVVDPSGRYLFVTNLNFHTVSVVDLEAGEESRVLPAGMAPFGLALNSAGDRLYVSHQYPLPNPFRTPPVLELSVIDVPGQFVRERRELHSTVIGQCAAVSPDDAFVATALALPKNLLPETQVYQGWMLTHGFTLTETAPGGRTAYLLVDEPNLYFADSYGIAFTPDGRYLLLSSSGVDVVTIVDMEAVYRLLRVEDGRIGISDEKIERYARHLALSNEYVVGRIYTGANPKQIVVAPDGRRAYVACRLADEISVIDIRRKRALEPIDLGGPRIRTTLRWGEQLINYATISFQQQMSCITCHPENSVDGLVYDIAADGGMGRNLVDNLTLRGIAQTGPFKWTGKNPTLERQEGPRAAQLFFRTQGFNQAERKAVVAFIESIPARPNPYRQAEGNLREMQEWGKELFERAYDNQGRYIPVANRCITCHPPPMGMDRRLHDVGTAGYHDQDGIRFLTPHLINVYERPPFLHDGRCYSLEELWTEFNDDDAHGVANDMLKEELNALIEYCKTF